MPTKMDPRCFCRVCFKETKHQVIAYKIQTSTNPREDWWHDEYQMVCCCGCDTISFRRKYVDDGCRDDDGRLLEDITMFPSVFQHKKPLKWTILTLPFQLNHIYGEIYSVLASQNYILASVGIRSVLEGICKDQKCQSKNLQAKIDDLKKMQLITPLQASNLHQLRFLGNISAHNLKTPSLDEILTALDVIEHLIQDLYYRKQWTKKLPIAQP